MDNGTGNRPKTWTRPVASLSRWLMTYDGKHSDGDEGHSQCKGGFFVVAILACGKGSMGPAIFIT